MVVVTKTLRPFVAASASARSSIRSTLPAILELKSEGRSGRREVERRRVEEEVRHLNTRSPRDVVLGSYLSCMQDKSSCMQIGGELAVATSGGSSRGETDTALAALPVMISDAIWSRLSPHPAPNHSVTAREQRIPNLFSSRTHTPSLTPSTSFGDSSEHGGGHQPSRRRGKARGKWNGKAASTPALGPSVGPHALVSAWGGATGGCGAWARAMGAFA